MTFKSAYCIRKIVLFLIFLPVCLLIIISCGQIQQDGSALPENTLDVFIAPIDNEIEPLVFIDEAGTRVCRRRPIDTDYGLDPEDTAVTEDADGNDGEGTGTSNQPITTDVGENWFQTGLVIVNKHNSYYAVIRQLVFIISGNFGDTFLENRVEISAGYCQSDPLYIAPPTPAGSPPNQFRGNLFEPEKTTSGNNLVLFVSGVPVPDCNDETSPDSESDTLNDIRSEAQDSGGNAQSQQACILRSIPRFRVQLHVFGYWIDQSRSRKAILRKRITFNLSSQFLN